MCHSVCRRWNSYKDCANPFFIFPLEVVANFRIHPPEKTTYLMRKWTAIDDLSSRVSHPYHKEFIIPLFKSCKHTCCCYMTNEEKIRLQFRTYPDSCVVVVCGKLWPERFDRICICAKLNELINCLWHGSPVLISSRECDCHEHNFRIVDSLCDEVIGERVKWICHTMGQ